MAMRAILAFLLLLSPLAARAQDAMLRPFAMVEDAVVRLSDLFEGLGPRGAQPLGPAPAPGQRMVIEAPQLAAIARQNGIVWRSNGMAERVVLERPGRPVAREEVLALLRVALGPLGVDEDADLELQGFAPPLVPPAGAVQLAIEQAGLDPGGQRFAATLTVIADGMPILRQRLAGRVVTMAPVLVAARRLMPGESIGPRDVKLVRMPMARLRPGLAERPDQAVGLALRRPAAADQPLLLADLSPPLVVERGAMVTMLYDAPGMTLSAQGRAMEGAARGAVVPVMNLASRVVVEAEVIAPGRVRVGSGR